MHYHPESWLAAHTWLVAAGIFVGLGATNWASLDGWQRRGLLSPSRLVFCFTWNNCMNEFGVPNLRTDERHVCAAWVRKRISRAFGHLVVVFQDCLGNLQVMRLTRSCSKRMETERFYVIGTYDRNADFNWIIDDLETADYRTLCHRIRTRQHPPFHSLSF